MKSATLSALLAGAIALPCIAQTPAQKSVSRDELRACMDTEAQVTGRREVLAARNAKVAEERSAVKAESDALVAEEKTIREDDYKARDRFNRKLKETQARITTVNASSDALRAEVQALTKDLNAYNQTCGGISYLAEDKAAILKEREAAARK